MLLKNVDLRSTLVLVQRIALSFLSRHWTENIINNFHGGYKNRFVFVSNTKFSHKNIYSYRDPVTWHASLPPPGTPAQIILAVIPP